MIIISGFLAMGVGITLLMYGLAIGDAGVVATLTATTPVLILPLLWMTTGIQPPLVAFISAVVTLLGIEMITIGWN